MPSPIQSPPPIDGPVGTPSSRTLGTGAQQAAAGNDSRLTTPTNASVTPAANKIPLGDNTGVIATSWVSNLSGTNSGNVTLGTANGLSITSQVLSLSVATTSVAGALSAADKVKVDDLYLDARNYGLATAGSGSANYTALQAAIAAAIAAGRTLYIPAGTYTITVPFSNTTYYAGSQGECLSITGNVKIVGAGKFETILNFGPNPVTYNYDGFRVDPGVTATFEDFTVTGPTGSLTYTNNTGIHHQGGTDGNLYLRRMRVLGTFYTGCQQEAGTGIMDGEEFECTALITATACWGGKYSGDTLYSNGKRYHLRNSYIHDCGQTNTSDDGHLVYAHPNVSIRFEGVRFANNNSSIFGTLAINHNSSGSYSQFQDKAKYLIVDNCYFESTCKGNILATDYIDAPIVIKNTVFCSTEPGVKVRSNASIDSCLFNTGNDGVRAVGTGGAYTVNITNCDFLAVSTFAINTVWLIDTWASSVWNVSHCRFTKTAANTSPLISHNYTSTSDTAQAYLYVDHCYFNVTSGTCQAHIAASKYASIRNCRFAGAPDNAIAVADFNSFSQTAILDIWHNYFEVSTTSINLNNAASATVNIHGGENYVTVDKPFSWRAEHKGNMLLRQGAQSTALTIPTVGLLANTLSINWNADQYNCSTTNGTLASIQINGNGAETRACSGPLRCYFTNGVTLSSSDNIVPLNTLARAPGSHLKFHRDPILGKWVEEAADNAVSLVDKNIIAYSYGGM